MSQRQFIYSKKSIAQFLSLRWDRRLKADGSLLFKNDGINVDTLTSMGEPFIRRFERREQNVHYLDFLHGRSGRFMDFRKRVGLTDSDVCEDCGDLGDSVEHKLFSCINFSGQVRDNFIQSLGDRDYREAVLFAGNRDIRYNFRVLVDEICCQSEYDYRDVLNR